MPDDYDYGEPSSLRGMQQREEWDREDRRIRQAELSRQMAYDDVPKILAEIEKLRGMVGSSLGYLLECC